jgi:hypothetical protein
LLMLRMRVLIYSMQIVTTLASGSQPRQGVVRLRAKKEARESHHMFPWMSKSVREWTFILPNELPCQELESQMDSRIFKA